MKIVAYNDTIEDGWFLCDGSAPSRTTYAELFAKIGTTYGVGDGTTTFNLPNFIDRVVQGAVTAGTYKAAGLPNITGELWQNHIGELGGIHGSQKCYSGAFTFGNKNVDYTSNWNIFGNAKSVAFNASLSNSIYGSSNTVQPPALTCRVLIKYK